jgi:hypothetical protein
MNCAVILAAAPYVNCATDYGKRWLRGRGHLARLLSSASDNRQQRRMEKE